MSYMYEKTSWNPSAFLFIEFHQTNSLLLLLFLLPIAFENTSSLWIPLWSQSYIFKWFNLHMFVKSLVISTLKIRYKIVPSTRTLKEAPVSITFIPLIRPFVATALTRLLPNYCCTSWVTFICWLAVSRPLTISIKA